MNSLSQKVTESKAIFNKHILKNATDENYFRFTLQKCDLPTEKKEFLSFI